MHIFKSKFRIIYIFLIIFFSILFIYLVNPNTALADDYQNALDTVPKGLKWSDDDFKKAGFEGNSATIVNSNNPESPDTSVIKVTNGLYQVGGIWSNANNYNYFDIDHDQTASMWLYFGHDKATGGDGMYPGDGMAFVIQNDPRTTDAHSTGTITNKDKSTTKVVPGNGETLGVWGTDWDTKETEPTNIAKNAIQNSVAIEFDTFMDRMTNFNDISGEGVSFDVGTYGQKDTHHIAANYPGEASTYIHHSVTDPTKTVTDPTKKVQNTETNTTKAIDTAKATDSTKEDGTKNYFSLLHLAYTSNINLVDSKWHHLTIHWTKATYNQVSGKMMGKLTYYYDDKNPDGTATNTSKVSTMGVDISKFNTTDGKLHWGFTGATGRYTENNLIAFESLPSFVDAEAQTTIHNDTANKEVPADGHVDTQDKITYNYDLKYIGWTRTWSDIKAKMQIPANMTFSSGEVTYANGLSETIPSSAFSDPQYINYTLQQHLDKDNRTAKISLHGQAAKTSTNQLTVPTAHAHFDGDNLITDTDTTSFIIDPRSITLKSSTPDIIKINKNDSVDIPAQVDYLGNESTKPDYTKMTVYQKINDQDYVPLTTPIAADGSFTLHLDNSQLNESSTPISFYVKDPDDSVGQTNTLSRMIQIGGTVAFGEVSNKVSFKNIYWTSRNQLVPRLDKWNINVIDSRDKGSSWSVQAQASNLINTNKQHTLYGNLVYRENPDSQAIDLTNNVHIASHTKNSDNIETNNIASQWTDQSGILLALNNSNQTSRSGNYTGTINWTLLDSIDNA